ncbi:hypothetical protein MHBO_005096 [Bonamia ostreae]|uniref:40S ribosomal protein S24 n=1 Tax=Bonamia ostreae TaxID=126728 RepID=A0ABV2AV51_9EUKA
MTGKNFELHTRKFKTNPLLSRREMVLAVKHPGMANVSKKTLKETLAAKYNVKDPETIVLFGFRTQFGGGSSTGFARIYTTADQMKGIEPRHRLVRLGVLEKVTKKSRKSIKELKNRKKKVRGKKKAAIGKVNK